MTTERKQVPQWLAALVTCVAVIATTAVALAQASDAIRPFSIQVSDAALADLKTRLDMARIPEPLQGAGWTHGTDIAYLRQLVAYWRTGTSICASAPRRRAATRMRD